MAKEIEIIISKDGKCKLDVKGVKGSACEELTKKLEEAMGVVVSREKKPEFHVAGQKLGLKQKRG